MAEKVSRDNPKTHQVTRCHSSCAGGHGACPRILSKGLAFRGSHTMGTPNESARSNQFSGWFSWSVSPGTWLPFPSGRVSFWRGSPFERGLLLEGLPSEGGLLLKGVPLLRGFLLEPRLLPLVSRPLRHIFRKNFASIAPPGPGPPRRRCAAALAAPGPCDMRNRRPGHFGCFKEPLAGGFQLSLWTLL